MTTNPLPLQTTASSSTLHYSRDPTSISQPPTILPSPMTASFHQQQQQQQQDPASYAYAYDDGEDDDDEWRRGGMVESAELATEEGLSVMWEGMQHWVNKRHLTNGNPTDIDESPETAPPWRLRSRLKTFSAALVLCLNIGVDPPDVVKTQPCAKSECWIDPGTLPATKALEAIGKNLEEQFKTLSPKVRYKQYLDPSVEDTKKFCSTLRKSAKEERVLMYYNGHGVPRPTASGEIWVFNKNYTQYIPVSLYDLQAWLGSPCIFVWDCSAAGNIINNFNRWAERRDTDAANSAASSKPPVASSSTSDQPTDPSAPPSSSPSFTPFLDCIHLAACQADQVLPMTPELPADLFTCCLTSPIEIALRFFVLQDPLRANADPSDPRSKITVDLSMRIPGDLKDRRTPLGELNWIFTAVTDTIAWLVFPRDIFKRLFRQDLLVAALFRNFLLAERIMRAYNCTPMSHPVLPATHNHPLWQSWDLAVDACLSQLPALLEAEEAAKANPSAPLKYVYQPSRFFAEHLKAFEVWLQQGAAVSSHLSLTPSLPNSVRKPPDQLPIVLQVLLSQAHRLRALILLSKFVDLGPWAVHLALSIGIFPYVQKLLQSPAADLKPVLIFIWTRILAVDRSCQVDLLKDNGFSYFTRVLAPATPQTPPLLIPNASEHRAMCAFILSMVCRGFRQGQLACMSQDVFTSCFTRLQEDDWLLKQWSALCIAQLWADGNDEAKRVAITESYQDQLLFMLKDESAEVRCAAMYALSTFLGASGMPAPAAGSNDPKLGGGGTGAQLTMTERSQLKLEAGVSQACVLQAKEDASPLVRKDLVVVLSCVAREWRGWFVAAAWTYHEQENRRLDLEDEERAEEEDGDDLVRRAMQQWGRHPDRADGEHQENMTILFIFKFMFAALLDLSVDPHPEVATLACTVVDYITALLLDSAFTRARGSTLNPRAYMEKTNPNRSAVPPVGLHADALSSLSSAGTDKSSDGPMIPPIKRSDTGLSSASRFSDTIKRSSSIANALKNLATMTGYTTPQDETSSSVGDNDSIKPTVTRQSTSNHLHVTTYVPPYPLASASDVPTVSTQPFRKSQERVQRTSSLGNMLSHQMMMSPGRPDAKRTTPRPRDAKFNCAEVIEALTEEDMERLRIRRTSKTEAGGGADGRAGNGGRAQPHELGLGMVAKEVKDDVLPLRSDFYDYSLEYFKEPQMKIPDADEPGSVKYNEQTWRQQRNQKMMEVTRIEDEPAAHSPWTRGLGVINNDSWPSLIAFHAYESEMAVSDEADGICVWDWKSRRRINRFSNVNAPGTSITSLHFINETASSLLLTAASDGNVRIWRDYQTDTPALASAFRGLSERATAQRPAGVVTSWSQRSGHLLVGGDSKLIRLWDARIESLVCEFPTQASANATSISTSEDGDVFVAGFGDGVVRVFDKRLGLTSGSGEKGLVKVMRQHQTWVQSVWMRPDGELITGSMNGDVKIFDIRSSDTPLSSTRCTPHGLSSLAVHSQSRIFATASAPLPSTYSSWGRDGRSQAISYDKGTASLGRSAAGLPAPHSQTAPSRSQKLALWRIEETPDFGESIFENGAFDSQYTASQSTMTNGGGDGRVAMTGLGEQPTLLSESTLKGDVASTPVPNGGGQGLYGKRRERLVGAGMNAMSFHPNELVLAVGGFDHTYGSVRLITYNPEKQARNGVHE